MENEIIVTLKLVPSTSPVDREENELAMFLRVLLATYKLDEMEIGGFAAGRAEPGGRQ